MKKLLFLNACVNRETSRTYRIAKALISLLQKSDAFEVDELVLEDINIQGLTSETLNKRLELIEKGDFSSEIFGFANQLKEADFIVMAAPHWDFGFPTRLKAYLEATSIIGLLYKFDETGQLIGLCKAENLYYVTTRGGYWGDENDLGFSTIVRFGECCGINKIKCISSEGLDIFTNDPEELVNKTISDLPNLV
ncbi:MAG: NAD(P)H-dependent oxidoreductase [Eubacteriaceae bacterium]